MKVFHLENMKLTDYQVLLHGFMNIVLYFPVYTWCGRKVMRLIFF